MDSFWSVANALKDAVKQQTAEITASLQNTDWKTEINAFQEGLKEDTVEIGQKAKEVTEELGQKTIDVAKNLPQVVDEGRRKAVAQLEHLPGSSAARAKEAAAHLQQAGASLSQMGHRVVANTTEMFDHFSNAIQAEMNAAQERDLITAGSLKGGAVGASASSRSLHRGESSKFSRFDADVAAMQRDSSTYCDEPDDAEGFQAWAAAFDLSNAKPDISKILSENTFMSELQARIVPVVVDYDSFWTRYFYRLHKLEERHAKVAALASRAQMDDSDLGGWGTDEEEEKEVVAVEEEAIKPEVVQDANDDENQEKEAQPAVEEATAGTEKGAAPEVESNIENEIEKTEEEAREDEVEAINEADNAEIDESNSGSTPSAEQENEEKEEEALVTTDGKEKEEEITEKVAGESGKKNKKKTTGKGDDGKDEDELSSLDFSGAEDLPEGAGGDSDWDEDVAEWE